MTVNSILGRTPREHVTLRDRPASRSIAWSLLATVALAVLVELLDRHLSTRTPGLALPAIAVLGNTLPPLLAMLALFCLTGRVFFSFAVVVALCCVFYTVNFLKQRYLGSPISPADFYMLGQMGSVGWDIFSKYLPGSPRAYIAGAIALVCIGAIFRFEPRSFVQQRPRWVARAVGVSIAVSLVALLRGAGPWTAVYTSAGLASREVIYQTAINAAQNGLFTNQIQLQISSRYKRPKGDKKIARGFLASVEVPAAFSPTDTTPPDVIIIQSEAFFNPSILNGFTGPSTVTNYSALARNATWGNLKVPTMGGATIRTEFEVLTGISLRYFERIQYPYLQLNMGRIPNLIRTMKAHGYYASAIHGGEGAFWNRDTVFQLMGFDSFVAKNHFTSPRPDGNYTADRSMTDEIISQLQHKSAPQFLFAISIEAHGPYSMGSVSDVRQRDALPAPTGLSSQNRLEFQTYLYHARNADKELGRLATWLSERGRPYVLVFYGDHIPALRQIYQQLGFKDGRSEYTQPVPWILIDSSVQKGNHLNIASWMLPDLVLEHAGVSDNGYFAITRAMRATLTPLTQSPYQRPKPDFPEQKHDDDGMRQVARLRLRGKL